MENIVISEYQSYDSRQVLSLYKSVGWSAYYREPQTLERAFASSLCVFAAWDGQRLVGLIRVVGDGQTIVFIQDLLVRPEYQRQGIGRQLIAAVLARYRHVRQLHLLTDDRPETVGFYEAVGFTQVEKAHCRAFTRLRY